MFQTVVLTANITKPTPLAEVTSAHHSSKPEAQPQAISKQKSSYHQYHSIVQPTTSVLTQGQSACTRKLPVSISE